MTADNDDKNDLPFGYSEEDMEAFSRNFARIAENGARLVTEFMESQTPSGAAPMIDPLNIAGSFTQLAAKMAANPEKVIEAQTALWQDYLKLWENAAKRAAGEKTRPVIEPDKTDRRFKGADWSDNQIFDFIKQSYLLTAKHVQDCVHNVEGLSRQDAAKVDFYTRQYVDAMSPSNFALTNPEVLKATIEEKGENLARGFENMLEDLQRGQGKPALQMTDPDAFEVGRNIATTPGKVVFRNELLELIQYAPTTEEVYKTPLLIFPPWINKFYILDLTEQKSFVRWAAEQGHTVFIVSWVNPDERHAETGFEDYLTKGFKPALKAARKICGAESVNVIGYCVAGTMLAAALAYLAVKGKADQVNSATFFTAQVDFEEAGELQIFVDDKQLEAMERLTRDIGYLDGQAMAQTFNMLRSNDLIWSFVVNNYLLGKEPFPFDLLYWNSDSTRLPRAMHLYYLKNMYQENNLVKPGRIVLDGVPIDLSLVETPCYIQAGKEDHIAPAPSVFKILDQFKGPMRFVLAGSGHIAGVVNPPSARKYNYWTNAKKAETLEGWLEGATEHPGSWWPDWQKWISRKSGVRVPARAPGGGKYKPLGDAPGTYVAVKS